MPRNPTPTLLIATLAVGVVLGMAIDQTRISASAQAGPESAPPAAARIPRARGDEEAIYQQLERQYEQFQHVNRTFELVAKAVAPAVVHIVARKSATRESGQVSHYEETGSGVIVRAERGRTLYVLTNNHVVEGAAAGEININLHDGRVLHPERTYSDSKADVSVLKLAREDLPAARLGNSDDAAIGSWVLALGSPFGLTHSVSQGIISARGRHEKELENDGVENQDFLQTDAAINPGNSGGPLVNMKGEVIGINTAIASNGGGSEGVGFSIPINLAKWIMGQLVSNGKVSRGAMGVDLEDMQADQAGRLGLERPRGARVLKVHKGSPAALGGLRDGDVILRFNGVEVLDLNHLINLVSMAPIGRPADVIIWRDRQEQVRAVTVADRDLILARIPPSNAPPGPDPAPRRPARPGPSPDPGPASTATAVLGLELVTIDGASSRRLNLPEAIGGVAVSRVDPSSPLAPYIWPLDVITTLGGRPVRSADEVVRALNSRTPVELGLQRLVNGARQRLTVRVP